ncbi:metallophosphoesterase [Cyclobacterium marinum]|uniref:Metallophosphoesterase n=1 Tax=Cyclobacterium marinum (strain ATCC 25205 / DSM 745 / LMG 13164 / NCIMB 1802) TaxID=880070 RepID=G0J8I0_CYCMS|nr:metallophosphoesterase [Cyclobacterium marinum]AEL28780.1 metallophosphoesterase [Cyclobacterium marinum DSM 745]MBI0398616.1 metallophosphoesterase [Cyclobacterium marinum]MBR9777510.1 metallophosphoesterase [Cytophagales bacterium]
MKTYGFFLFLLLSCTFLCSCKNENSDSFHFMAIGDLPYHLPDDFERFERMIQQINDVNPAFTLHVGDIKSGKVPCSDEYYEKIKNYFNAFEKPLIYTPGDNEWTDCDRELCGSYDPEERLDKLRQLFFSDSISQGKMPIILSRQNKFEGFEKFPENSTWIKSGITFGTLHVIGSNNNFDTGVEAINDEFYERELANNFWLKSLFEAAKKDNSKGLVLVLHAGLNYNNKDEKNGHASFVTLLRQQVQAFDKPVLLLYGDQHRFLVSKPLRDNNGKTMTNFTAVQVFGDHDLHAVEIKVAPENPNLFEINPFYIKGN